MEESKKTKPEKTPLNDSIKLDIRDAVEQRFNSPPASLVKFIEDEVRQRIRRQEWYYYGLIFLFLFMGAAIVWGIKYVSIPDAVQKQLASEGALATQQSLSNILSSAQQMNFKLGDTFNSTKSHADDVNTNLNKMMAETKSTADNVNNSLSQLPNSINTNVVVPLGERLEQLKQQDNILLIDDLPKLFVRESITNLVDNNTIVLSHEPIPASVKVYGNTSGSILRFYILENCGYAQGSSIIFTNSTAPITAQVINKIQNGGILVEYIRKSLH